MPNNLPPPSPEEKLTPQEIRKLASEIFEFKKTLLYAHYRDHFNMLYADTVDRVIEEPLKTAETLYTREAWIGEARTAKLMINWFETLESEIDTALQELK